MAEDRLTGKASYMVFNGTTIPITKYNPTITKTLPDITDNGDYDVQTDLIYPTQLPVSAVTELSVEGRFHLNSTPSTIMSLLYRGASAIPVVLGLNAGSLFGHGLPESLVETKQAGGTQAYENGQNDRGCDGQQGKGERRIHSGGFRKPECDIGENEGYDHHRRQQGPENHADPASAGRILNPALIGTRQ